MTDVRQGVMQFDPQAVTIQGKTARGKEINTGMRWDQMREILLAPLEKQACFVYDAPNFAGTMITFSLAFMPAPGYYEMAATAVRQYATVPIKEGRLKNATKTYVWIMLILLLLLFAFIMALNKKEGYNPTLQGSLRNTLRHEQATKRSAYAAARHYGRHV